MAANIIVRSEPGERFTQVIEAGEHRLFADEPEPYGGSDRGPGPYELLLAALGACTSITLRMYAERKKWALLSVEVRLSHKRIHARDCEDCETKDAMLDEIRSEIHMQGNLDKAQRERLLEIAKRCPVHRTLSSEIKIRTSTTTAI